MLGGIGGRRRRGRQRMRWLNGITDSMDMGLGCEELSHLKRPLTLGKIEGRKTRGRQPDTPGSLEGNTEGPGTASSEPLLPS